MADIADMLGNTPAIVRKSYVHGRVLDAFERGELAPIYATAKPVRFLTRQEAALASLPTVRVIVALGKIAHDAAARALGMKLVQAPFGHGSEVTTPGGRILLGTYHSSRYNQNTRRLTPAMFEAVFERAVALRDG